LAFAAFSSFSAWAFFSASSIFYCLSIKVFIFWLFRFRAILNSGVRLFQDASSFYNDSFSNWIRSLFCSKCSVKWLKYSSFFYFIISSKLSKIGLYFCFKVSWYTLSYCVLSIKDSCFF
jgi:hypothetical protein